MEERMWSKKHQNHQNGISCDHWPGDWEDGLRHSMMILVGRCWAQEAVMTIRNIISLVTTVVMVVVAVAVAVAVVAVAVPVVVVVVVVVGSMVLVARGDGMVLIL